MSTIILDRDGVINFDSDDYIKSPEEWIPIPRSLDAIGLLCQHDFDVYVVTNQSGIARHLYDVTILNAIHDKMMRAVESYGGKIKEVAFCPHHPSDHCSCRKPEVDLFYQLQKKHQFCFQGTYFVGDSISDMQAACKIGCIGALVLTGNGCEAQKLCATLPTKVQVFKDLYEAAQHIIGAY